MSETSTTLAPPESAEPCPGEVNQPPDSNLYETPPEFFHRLNAEFRFDVDLFASADNALCRYYFSEQRSAFDFAWHWRAFGLRRQGTPCCFGNPPYSQQVLGPAVQRAASMAVHDGVLSVLLIPPSTDTAWWHRDVMTYASEVRLVEGRLDFLYRGMPITCMNDRGRVVKNSNRGASCVVVFRPGVHRPQFSSMPAVL